MVSLVCFLQGWGLKGDSSSHKSTVPGSLTAESTALTVSSTFCAHGRDLRMFSLKGQYLNDHQLHGSEGCPENVLLQNIIKIEWKGGQGFHRLRRNSEISTLGKTSLIQRIIHTKWGETRKLFSSITSATLHALKILLSKSSLWSKNSPYLVCESSFIGTQP